MIAYWLVALELEFPPARRSRAQTEDNLLPALELRPASYPTRFVDVPWPGQTGFGRAQRIMTTSLRLGTKNKHLRQKLWNFLRDKFQLPLSTIDIRRRCNSCPDS